MPPTIEPTPTTRQATGATPTQVVLIAGSLSKQFRIVGSKFYTPPYYLGALPRFASGSLHLIVAVDRTDEEDLLQKPKQNKHYITILSKELICVR